MVPEARPARDPGIDRFKKTELPILNDGTKAGDGFSYEIPLGEPITSIQLKQLENEDRQFRSALEMLISDAIELDYRNIAYRKGKIPYTEEEEVWAPGKLHRSHILFHLASDEKINALLHFIAPAITSLLIKWHVSGSEDDLAAIVPLAKLLYEKYGYYDVVAVEHLRQIMNAKKS